MNFILNRDRTIATPFGHAIEFKKGMPTHVPPGCYDTVIAAGAVPEEEIPEPPKTGNEEPGDPDVRMAAIIAASEKLLESSKRGDFTGSGVPHVKALARLLGWEPTNNERDAAWKKMHDAE